MLLSSKYKNEWHHFIAGKQREIKSDDTDNISKNIKVNAIFTQKNKYDKI